MTQGYMAMAFGHRKFLDMAENLAISIKCFDPKRPICLAHDESLADAVARSPYFDHRVQLEQRGVYVGTMNKLRLYEATPYDETMYVDADCLMVRDGIDAYWQLLSASDFNMAGEEMWEGRWYDFEVARVREALNVPYVVRLNAGAFYFKKSPGGQAFFDLCHNLVEKHADILGHEYKNSRKGHLSDEPFIGVAMGLKKIEPIGQIGDNALMITTWHSFRFRRDRADGYSFNKVGRYLIPKLIPLNWTRHTPILMHFIDLKPRHVYQELVQEFRQQMKQHPVPKEVLAVDSVLHSN